jgi:hypothetical protein
MNGRIAPSLADGSTPILSAAPHNMNKAPAGLILVPVAMQLALRLFHDQFLHK